MGKTSIPVIQKETVTALPARIIVSFDVEFTTWDDPKRFAFWGVGGEGRHPSREDYTIKTEDEELWCVENLKRLYEDRMNAKFGIQIEGKDRGEWFAYGLG